MGWDGQRASVCVGCGAERVTAYWTGEQRLRGSVAVLQTRLSRVCLASAWPLVGHGSWRQLALCQADRASRPAPRSWQPKLKRRGSLHTGHFKILNLVTAVGREGSVHNVPSVLRASNGRTSTVGWHTTTRKYKGTRAPSTTDGKSQSLVAPSFPSAFGSGVGSDLAARRRSRPLAATT